MTNAGPGKPFYFDPVEFYLARCGNLSRQQRLYRALDDGIEYASSQAAAVVDDVEPARVSKILRKHLGIPRQRHPSGNFFKSAFLTSVYAESVDGSRAVRGILRELARQIVADLNKNRRLRRPFRRLAEHLFVRAFQE